MEVASVKVSADNPFCEPNVIPFTDIIKILEYACSIAMQEFTIEDFQPQ